MILLAHAYSRKNRGDGLLVDLALEVIRESVGNEDVVVSCTDPESFAESAHVISGPMARGRSRWREIASSATLAFGLPGPTTEFARALQSARGVVGVGGGYLRAGHFEEAAKSTLVHLAQLSLISASQKPAIYLPQSVGPICNALRPLYRDRLGRLNRIYVRDDRSLRDLNIGTARRAPDLAVMKLAKSFDNLATKEAPSKCYLIARTIAGTTLEKKIYIQKLKRIRELIPDCIPVIQSVGGGNDDGAFYQQIGWGDEARSADSAFSNGVAGVVISVRLHGALQGLISGNPAIHLSYERKGFGAYEDLGISEWVHPVKSFDPESIVEQVSRIRRDPSRFWDPISRRREELCMQWSEITQYVRRTFGHDER